MILKSQVSLQYPYYLILKHFPLFCLIKGLILNSHYTSMQSLVNHCKKIFELQFLFFFFPLLFSCKVCNNLSGAESDAVLTCNILKFGTKKYYQINGDRIKKVECKMIFKIVRARIRKKKLNFLSKCFKFKNFISSKLLSFCSTKVYLFNRQLMNQKENTVEKVFNK